MKLLIETLEIFLEAGRNNIQFETDPKSPLMIVRQIGYIKQA